MCLLFQSSITLNTLNIKGPQKRTHKVPAGSAIVLVNKFTIQRRKNKTKIWHNNDTTTSSKVKNKNTKEQHHY